MNVAQLIKPKSDQLNADDLIGNDKTVTITAVESGSTEQPLKVFFEGDNGKPYKPGKSMMRVMVYVWGAETDDWIGQSMRLYNDPNVKFGGINVGGIRISHMTGLKGEKSFPLTVARARRSPYTVRPLDVARKETKAAPPAELTDMQKLLVEDAKSAALSGLEAYQAWFTARSQEEKVFLANSGNHETLKQMASS